MLELKRGEEITVRHAGAMSHEPSYGLHQPYAYGRARGLESDLLHAAALPPLNALLGTRELQRRQPMRGRRSFMQHRRDSRHRLERPVDVTSRVYYSQLGSLLGFDSGFV